MMSHWASDETKTANFGDERLNKRMEVLLEQLGNKPTQSIPIACGGWAETLAAYRFFDNDKVTFEQVLESHVHSSIERISCYPVVLLIQDTTDLIHTVTKGLKGIGNLKEIEKKEVFLHPTIAITPDRLCLGVVGADIWKREEKSPRKERRNKPINEKESHHWLNGYQIACEVSGSVSETLIVNIADREGDIYEWFLETQEYSPNTRSQWIIRAAQNRCLETSDKETRKIWNKLEKQPVLGTIKFNLPASGNRKARKVEQTVRSASIIIKAPYRAGYKFDNVKINVVLAKEENPPVGEKPIEWLLLTSMKIDTFEQAVNIIKWYTCRWEIEIFFRTLKSGCQVEKLQLETSDRLEPCLAFYMIITWRILFITMFGRTYPELDCELLFAVEEWQAIHLVLNQTPLPTTSPSIGEIIPMIARLGGYLGRKNDGPPGPKSIWIGLQRMRDFVLILYAMKNA
ncbi:IS4 family transposase [Candidatus Halobeggiatoa sp. HSG11]|nr:IS4 family transposase [Candidatus Halobeggiatoa sp. HSG11]